MRAWSWSSAWTEPGGRAEGACPGQPACAWGLERQGTGIRFSRRRAVPMHGSQLACGRPMRLATPPGLGQVGHAPYDAGGGYRRSMQPVAMAFDVRQIFAALNDARVDYVVVGGLAVILHGYLRATADLDLAIGLSPDNAQRGMQSLASIGLRPRLPVALEDFADPDKRADWLNHRNMRVFPLWDPANPLRSVDVFIDEPIAFERLLDQAVSKDLGGLVVRVASIPHLIEMKQRAARPRDLEDIDRLRQILDGRQDGDHARD